MDRIITIKIIETKDLDSISKVISNFYNGFIDKIEKVKTDRIRYKAYKNKHTHTSNADLKTILEQLEEYYRCSYGKRK